MESISKISGMLETARDLTLEAARDASFARKPSARPIPPIALKKLLDSRREGDVLDGLRRVISMSYKKQATLQYFSHVVKNIASPSLEIKKLVYSYLVQHAEEAPDMALLSINTIQKSLSDTDPHLRALALRTMSSIRVPVISQIVALGIKRGVADMSPYVRRAAALAIPKCYGLNPDTLPLLTDQIAILLGDKQYYVAGAAVMAFLEICPERLDLVHPHYRSLVKKLVDMDEWGQLATIRLMMVYARKCFPRVTRKAKSSRTAKPKSPSDFYDSEPEDELQNHITNEEFIPDSDLELLLTAAKSLLMSRNAAVIAAVSRMYFYIGTSSYLQLVIGPLISLLRSSEDVQQVALHNIIQICLRHPHLFAPYTSHFLLHAQDGPLIQDLKLEFLTLIFPHSNTMTRSLILSELSHFTNSSNTHLVRAAVEAIGRCAQSASTPELSSQCLQLLLAQLSSSDANLVASSLDVIRHLIQRDPTAHVQTIVRLAKSLDALTAPSARASIIWLVGEYAATDPEHNIAADVLRILVKSYPDEEDEVKAQIVLLAAKVYLQYLLANKKTPKPVTAPTNVGQETPDPETKDGPGLESGGWGDDAPKTSHEDSPKKEALSPEFDDHPIPRLWRHAILLSRYTPNYDLRDRTRLYRSLLSTPETSTDLASLLLLAPKPAPLAPSPSQARKGYLIGSSSLVVGVSGLKGYEDLPPWVAEGQEPDARLRDTLGSSVEYVSSTAASSSAASQLDAVAARAGIGTGAMSGTSAKTNGLNKTVGVGKEKTLDDWLDEENDGEEEEGSTEEESGSDDDDEEEEEEEEEEEQSDEDEEEESEYETESEDEEDEKAGLVR